MMNYQRLLDVCDFQGGTQPPKNEWVDNPQPGYVRMLQIRDYSQGDEKFIQYVKDSSKLHKCKRDDIMLSRYGYIGQAFTGLEGALFFASTFWKKLQVIFGECCISILERVADGPGSRLKVWRLPVPLLFSYC